MTVSSIGGASAAIPHSATDVDGGVVAIARSEPLDASALAVAVMPELSVTVLSEGGFGGATLLVVRQRDGQSALIELGDGYVLDIDRVRASVLLSNAGTGLRTTIWGENAAITLSEGEDAARFWGNVTFALDNGAVITAATARREDNPLVYMLDSLTVTKREAAVIIADLAAVADLGADFESEVRAAMVADSDALSITMSDDGWSIEHRTRDGLVLEQDVTRAGWVGEDTSVAADPALIAETAPVGLHGPNSGNLSGREFGRFVSWTVANWTRFAPAPAVRQAPLERSGEDRTHGGADRATELRRIYLASLRPEPTVTYRGDYGRLIV